jgi:hypothetical protein
MSYKNAKPFTINTYQKQGERAARKTVRQLVAAALSELSNNR